MSMLSWHGKCSSEELINSYLPDLQHSLYDSSDQKVNCTDFNNTLLISFEREGGLFEFEYCLKGEQQHYISAPLYTFRHIRLGGAKNTKVRNLMHAL